MNSFTSTILLTEYLLNSTLRTKHNYKYTMVYRTDLIFSTTRSDYNTLTIGTTY